MPLPTTMPSTSTAKRATGPVVLSDRGLAGLAAFGAALERVRRNLHEQLGPPMRNSPSRPTAGQGQRPGAASTSASPWPSSVPPTAARCRSSRSRRRASDSGSAPGGPAIDGLLSDATANGRVTQLHGGQGCGE
jgi:hypothetical protein